MDFKQELIRLRNEYTQRRDAIHADKWHENQAVEKDFAEQATQCENDDVLTSLDQEASALVMLIDNALLRIEDDSYGHCLECGKQIPGARLQLIPYAEYCIDCAERAEEHK
ncbi:MAG: TraR/DksA family transcriptional regulator [Gammaproteobacteria bacterium]|nr:TraR/DksA family transcriptional regulator [Gammaproteobacteria bacterium]